MNYMTRATGSGVDEWPYRSRITTQIRGSHRDRSGVLFDGKENLSAGEAGFVNGSGTLGWGGVIRWNASAFGHHDGR